MPITIDDSKWPIVLVTFAGRPTTEEFSRYLAQMTKYLQRAERGACIIDARDAPSPPAEHRKMQADWIKANKELIRERIAGTAMVFSSALFRFVLSTIFLLQPLPHPYTVVGTLEEAIVWCRQQLPKKIA